MVIEIKPNPIKYTFIKPYLNDIIIDLLKSDTCKIESTIAINFISSEDIREECVMHSKSDSTEVMPYDKAEDVIKELFGPLLYRYQIGLETLMR